MNNKEQKIGTIVSLENNQKIIGNSFAILRIDEDKMSTTINLVDITIVKAIIEASKDDLKDSFAYLKNKLPSFIVKNGMTGEESLRLDVVHIKKNLWRNNRDYKEFPITENIGELSESDLESYTTVAKYLNGNNKISWVNVWFPKTSSIKKDKREFNKGDVLLTTEDTTSIPIGKVVVITDVLPAADGFNYEYFSNGEVTCSWLLQSTIENSLFYVAPSEENGLKDVIALHVYFSSTTETSWPDIFDNYKVIGNLSDENMERLSVACKEWSNTYSGTKDYQGFSDKQKSDVLKFPNVTEEAIANVDMGWTHCTHCEREHE